MTVHPAHYIILYEFLEANKIWETRNPELKNSLRLQYKYPFFYES